MVLLKSPFDGKKSQLDISGLCTMYKSAEGDSPAPMPSLNAGLMVSPPPPPGCPNVNFNLIPLVQKY
ncbi:hypothetical protein MDA_GLEAN10009450 [Myotis davidii]|uniref:Uncharacterized protein n=1 Tax=Myotis davidii TaxID=225400 RepID=L5LDW2_MYODS|nr:hypothetical protein MDA_GLEAN10009450 [Myotis davidii]